jgi:5-methylcytosine-specific restriction endonuclease McrA
MTRRYRPTIAKSCLDCGVSQRHGARCALCDRLHRARRSSSYARGYDATYRRERARVIAAEPWCHANPCPYPDAGTPANPLTGEHQVPLSRGGYGSPLTVLCRSCNSSRGNRMGEGRGAGRSRFAPAGPKPLGRSQPMCTHPMKAH